MYLPMRGRMRDGQKIALVSASNCNPQAVTIGKVIGNWFEEDVDSTDGSIIRLSDIVHQMTSKNIERNMSPYVYR